MEVGNDNVVVITVPQMKTLNLMKIEYDHLQNQRRWDSTEIANYTQLSANLTQQVTAKDELIKDQTTQIDIYRDLATNCQGQSDKSLLKLAVLKKERTWLGSAAIALALTIAGILYFR